jgi:hypothetical protein
MTDNERDKGSKSDEETDNTVFKRKKSSKIVSN